MPDGTKSSNGKAGKTGLALAIERAGGAAALGRMVGSSRQAVGKWTVIPLRHVAQIARETGIPKLRLLDLDRR